MKENLLLLKDLLEPWKRKSTNTSLQYQKMYKLDDIFNKYSNTYHITIKKKPVDVKNNTHIDFNKKNNEKDPKFVDSDHVRI